MARQTREEREQEVRAQYEAVTDRLFSDKSALKAYLSFSGRHYKLPADHAMMVFHANPNADMVTDYDTWQRLGRQVERGQRSIAAFENGKLRHYFDISQTKGREIQPRWRFDSKLAAQYVEAYSTQAGLKFSTLTDCIDALTDEHTASAAQAAAKEFGISPEQERNFVKSVTMMARAVVAARCGYQSGFKYRSAALIDKYPWAMDMLQSKAQKEQLLALVQRSAKGALLSMEKTVNDIQRRNTYEQGYDSKRRSPNMVRGGQEALPRDNQGERQDVQARPDDVRLSRGAGAGADGRGAGAAEAPDRALRDSVAAFHGGESPAGDTRAQGQNEVGDNPASDRRGSRGNGVEHGAGVRAEESATRDVPGDSGMGENEAARGGTQSDDRPGASAQSINSTTATAEDNSPAVSVLEFIDLASYALYENSTVRSAHENSDKANFDLAVRAAVNSYYTLLISGQESSSYSVEQLAPLYNKFQQDKDFREEVFSAVTERVDKLLIELGRARTKAAELGIPFSDRIYDPNDPEEQSNDPYSYDGSMSVEDSRKAAAANNLHEFMSGYSDELKMAAASYSADEFRRYFADRAARALESNTEHYLDSLRSDRDYLNSVCDLVSPSVYNELREDIQREKRAAYSTNANIQISGADIEKLHSIEPRKSVLNFTDEEIAATAAFADTFQADIGNKSPFFRAKTGDWRDREQTTIPVIKVEDRNADFKSVRDDIKSRVILRGSAGNEDTGWDIQISRVGLEDTVNYGQKFKDKAVFNALYHIEEIVRSSVLLDTVTSERNNNNKALNTEFMHKLYGVFDFNGERYLAKLSIEEFPDANLNPLRRMYNLQDIKIEPLKHIGFEDTSLAHSVFNDSRISIAQLFQIVKSFDKDFYINKSKSLAGIRAASSTNSAVQEEKAWTPYIIADLKTWADNSAERASLERYNTFEEAKARFDELRSQQYNNEETRNADGIPYARLTLGIETKNGAVDIIHVRKGQNYLVDDFTRQPSILTNPSAMELINRAESEIGFDRVFSYKKLDNGSYDNGTDLSFSEWNEKNRLFAEQPKEQAESKAEPETQAQSGGFRITDETVLGEGGLKTKYQNNIAAITTLKAIESESRSATPEEQQILAKYAGWGGMPQVFDRANEQWSKEYRQLRELLTDDEYKAAAESTLNAHYTSPEIINAMYKALGNFGFSGGNVLEPAMGVGNFFGCMPQGMSSDSKLYGVELDSITGRIAKQLYPQADIRVQGYEKAAFADNFFDAAVGNVPFGNYGVADRRYDKEHFLIHDYFFAKTLDKVAPNGIVAFITSKGTLDKQNPKVREYLAKRADLIGAIRLPNNAFKANAGTEVTADIIFLQKREKMAVEPPDWCYTAENSDGITVNQYFIDHPEMVLGKLEHTTGPFGQETTCAPIEGEKLSEQLERAVSNLHAQAKQQKREVKQNKEQGVIPATDDVRNFTHSLVDGKLYFRENNIMRQVTQTGKDLKRMIGLHELRQTMVQLIEAQNRSCTDVELQSLQQKLDTQYESFKKSYGSINDRLNANVFRADDDYNTLCSLEIIDPEKKTTEKSDIFTQRTIKPNVEVTHVDTPQEAMQVSMDVKGRVDIGYMSALCGSSGEDIVAELSASALILPDPALYDPEKPLECYVQSSEYLSGNVRNKLRAAQYAARENPELFSRNVTELENVIPPTIEAGEITARLGASWVDVEDYEVFLHEYIGRSVYYINLRRTISGEYKLENKTSDRSAAATSIYGTERLSAYHIFENLLNHRDIKVTDRIELGDGKCRYELNKDETQLANEKVRQMSEAFSRWLWDDPARRSKYTERYNELFNSIVGRNYDGAHQTFPGMSPYIQLKPHQKDAVARAKYGGNTLLAHCVGAGKSFEMIAATMEKKRLGLINKACVVVPKALVGQTANEWLRLYPQAKILVAGDKDFSKDNRQKFIGRCCTGDYAAVVMSYEQFEKIPMSLEYKRRFLERELETVQQGLEELSPIRDRASVKDLQQEQKRIRAKIERLLEGGKTKDNSLTFEQLGFDSLVVDEAHSYKNGLVVSKMSNISGVTTNPAQKSEDILMKTQYLNETYGNKNILFATGTPVFTPYQHSNTEFNINACFIGNRHNLNHR